MLDGRGSSLAEQASQKIPPQFLQMFFVLVRLPSSWHSWHICAFAGPDGSSCSSFMTDCILFGRTAFSPLPGSLNLAFSSWIFCFPSIFNCIFWQPLPWATVILFSRIPWCIDDNLSLSRFNSCSSWSRCLVSCSTSIWRLLIFSPNSCLKSRLSPSADWRSLSACRNLDLSHMNCVQAV